MRIRGDPSNPCANLSFKKVAHNCFYVNSHFALAVVGLCFSALVSKTFPLTPLMPMCDPPVPMRAL